MVSTHLLLFVKPYSGLGHDPATAPGKITARAEAHIGFKEKTCSNVDIGEDQNARCLSHFSMSAAASTCKKSLASKKTEAFARNGIEKEHNHPCELMNPHFMQW